MHTVPLIDISWLCLSANKLKIMYFFCVNCTSPVSSSNQEVNFDITTG